MSIMLAIPSQQVKFLYNEINLGMGSLMSILRSKGIEVKMADFSDYSTEEVIDVIKKERPKILGMRCLTPECLGTIRMLDMIKNRFSSIKTVLGGPHPTIMYRQILQHCPSVDYIVIGEGEKTFFELIKTIYNNGDPYKIAGIAFKEGEKIITTEKRALIKDLNSLPFPELEYDITKKRNNKIEKIFINTCRGCPMSCTFCTSNTVWGNSYRTMSAKRIGDTIEHYIAKYGANRIYFCDDTINSSKERVISLCKEIINRKLNIVWSSAARVDKMDEETINWMKESGCIRLEFGVESGSPALREKMKKRISNEQIINAFNLAKKVHIDALAFIMWGYPGESLKTIYETISLVNKIKPSSLCMSICTVFPGTELMEMQKAKGKLRYKFWLNPITSVFSVVGFIKRFLLSILNLFLVKFFRRKGIIVDDGFKPDKKIFKR